MEYIDILDAVRRIEGSRVPRRMVTDRSNPLQALSDRGFIQRYRLSKDACLDLLDLLRQDLTFSSTRCDAIPPVYRLLVALRFYATGHFQRTDGDLMLTSKGTVCHIVHQVSQAIAKRKNHLIRFPLTAQDLQAERSAFYGEHRFPNVIGLIDGTHIPISSPGGDNAEVFRNRKGYFSINIQVVCRSDMEFCHITARWPGSTHDTRILSSGTLPSIMSKVSGFLLGDAGYPCMPYLMTPLPNPGTHAEERYNHAHIATRIKIERSFGVWKQRFRCLRIPLRTRLDNSLVIIVATACLHNFAVRHRLDCGDRITDDNEPDLVPAVGQDSVRGNVIRSQLVANHF